MKKWCDIRMRVLRDGESIRKVCEDTGHHFDTVKKILTHPQPPKFRTPARPRPKIGPFLERIASILEEDKEHNLSKKQRHTAKRIFDRIRTEGYEGGYTQVKEAVRELKGASGETFMPLTQRPGEAQMDFGEAAVMMDGALRKALYFAITLPYSGAMYIRAYPRECTETFQDGHVHAFRWFGGVPTRISYDNAKTSIAKIIGTYQRKLTNGFLQLQSHYLFEEHFCRVRCPNEKGSVENVVGFARQNYFVPRPDVKDFDELNAYLEQCCEDNLAYRTRGKKATKGVLLEEDRAALLALPATDFDACRKASTTVNKLALVRFDCNDYSVPVRHAFQTVLVKGYIREVRICRNDIVIAKHERLWAKEEVAFEPLHYLELLERKPGALDHGRPLEEWKLPECFEHLRGRLEEGARAEGTREFISVLRLLEKHPVKNVEKAIGKALRLRHCNRDVVAQFLYPDELFTPPTFRLDGRAHLQGVYVATPDITVYRQLLGGQ